MSLGSPSLGPAAFSAGTLARFLAGGLALAAIAGCSDIPSEGPSATAVAESAVGPGGVTNYLIQDINSQSARQIRAYYAAQEAAPTWNALPAPQSPGMVGPGDGLHLALWDASGPTGAEAQAASGSGVGRPIELMVGVDGEGTISVPYAGRWRVAGKSPAQIERDIVVRLKTKFAAPQASVTVAQEIWNTVFLQGAIKRPGRIPLPPTGLKLLDALALAGGPEFPEPEDVVEMVRGGTRASFRLSEVNTRPDANIALSPGDVVVVLRRPQYLFAFGAVNRSGQQVFDSRVDRLVDLIGQIGGIADARADPAGVFVFRYEPAELVRQLGRTPDAAGAPQPVAYRIDMNQPDSFFVMSTFPVRPGDTVYVANAGLVDVNKVMQAITGVTTGVGNVGAAARY